jgi:hypothetical protein
MNIRTLRNLLLIQILSLVLVAALHAGIVTGTPFERAAIYEFGVAMILAIGLALTYAGRAIARWGAFTAQLLALLGVGTGVYMALNGMAPNTVGDYAYHLFAVVLLLAGIAGALRLETADAVGSRGATRDSLGRGRT